MNRQTIRSASHLFKHYYVTMDLMGDPLPQIHIGETLSEPVFLDQIEHPLARQRLQVIRNHNRSVGLE